MLNRKWIEARFRDIPDVLAESTFLSDDQARQTINAIETKLKSTTSQQRMDQLDTVRYDISACSSSDARAILSEFAGESMNVKVVWVSDRVGIDLHYRTFVAHFDDFWYPSSDDVWVTDDRVSFLIELDHEELVMFTRF